MKQNNTTWLTISKSALVHNIKQFLKITSPRTEIMAVVKSNAYGHGLVECAKIFSRCGCRWLGTVNLEEALTLRKNGIRSKIVVLSYFSPDQLNSAIKNKISLTVYSYGAAKKLSEIATRKKTTATIHIKIDTGASRLGISVDQAIPLLKKIGKLPNLKIEGIFSHFADAENPNQSFTNKQIKIFNNTLDKIEKEGIKIKYSHIACSAAAILNKESHNNLVRIGISAYGLWSIENNSNFQKKLRHKVNLKPALSWYTKIIQIKTIPKNQGIGYSRTFKVKEKTIIAIIPVGYYEGYDRKLSNCGEVLIQGKRCKIRGRVCMNLSMVDITHLKDVQVGDTVTLIGSDKKETITADELALKTQTINYEIISRINPSLPKILIN